MEIFQYFLLKLFALSNFFPLLDRCMSWVEVGIEVWEVRLCRTVKEQWCDRPFKYILYYIQFVHHNLNKFSSHSEWLHFIFLLTRFSFFRPHSVCAFYLFSFRCCRCKWQKFTVEMPKSHNTQTFPLADESMSKLICRNDLCRLLSTWCEWWEAN